MHHSNPALTAVNSHNFWSRRKSVSRPFRRSWRERVARNREAAAEKEEELAEEKEPLKDQADRAVQLSVMIASGDLTKSHVIGKVLEKRQSNIKGCTTLPMSLAFFALYVFAMRLHEDTTNSYFLESALTSTLLGQAERVDSIPQVWTWLRSDFVDGFFMQENIYGEPLPSEDWSRVLGYSQVHGSVILEQVRSNPNTWGVRLDSADNYTEELQASDAGFVALDATGSPEARRLGILHPELATRLDVSEAKDRTYRFDLYPTMPRSEIQDRLGYLEQRAWLDGSTAQFTIKALLLNAELGRPRILRVRIVFHVVSGGSVYIELQTDPLLLETFPSRLCVAADATWLAMLAGTSVVLLRDAVKAGAESSCRSRMREPAFVVECAISAIGFAHVFLFWVVNVPFMGRLNERLAAVTGLDPAAGVPAQEQSALHLHAAADELHWWTDVYRQESVFFCLVLMLRFFYAFGAQPRLAIVLNTLKAVSVDLIHFLGVIMPTFVAYVISANLLFGRRLAEFSTFMGAASTCFRIAMENEFDWERLSEEHFWTTGLWVWSFLVLVSLIMLHMVLAITLDVYQELRRNATDESAFNFLQQIIKRLWHHRTWVQDREIAASVKDFDAKRSVSKDDLKEIFPSMADYQLDTLFDACVNHMNFQLGQEMQRSTFLKIAVEVFEHIQEATAAIHKTIDKPDGIEDPSDGLPSEGEADDRPEWLQDLRASMSAQRREMKAIVSRLQDLQWEAETRQSMRALDKLDAS